MFLERKTAAVSSEERHGEETGSTGCSDHTDSENNSTAEMLQRYIHLEW